MTLLGHPHTFRCTTNQGALDEELTTLVGFSAMPRIFMRGLGNRLLIVL